MEDVIIAMPWANTVDVVTIPGSALKSTLEHSVSNYDANSEDPGGRFLQFSGLVATFDVRQEPGSRLVSAKLGRPEERDEFREIDDEENYQVNFTGLACLFFSKALSVSILGHGVSGRRGVQKGPAGGGGFGFFLKREGNNFCSRRGEGYCNIAKKCPKTATF